MNGRLNRLLVSLAAALVAALTVASVTELTAQDAQGRFRVMVPRFSPDQGADDGFGNDTAERIRDHLGSLASYRAIEEDDIEDGFDRFGIKYDDVVKGTAGPDPCTSYKQLGQQINAEVALCARYRRVDNDNVEVYEIAFWQLQSNQAFEVEPFTIDKDDDEGAAERILASFDRYVEQSTFRTYCAQYAQSQEWESALRNCNQALEINPQDIAVLERRAYVYGQQDQLESALADLETILEIDPANENILQRAGYVATTLGRADEGRSYYGRYLEMNPGDVAVRRTIAYEVYEAGDPEGAMLVIEEGIGIEEDPNLLRDLGGYAFHAASQLPIDTAAAGENGAGTSGRKAELYRTAVDALMKVYEIQPDSMRAADLQNVIAAQTELGELDQAIAVGERVTQTHSEEPAIWATYAGALQRAGRLDDALQAMSEVERLDPEYNQLYARQGIWLLEAERFEEAVPYLQKAVERGNDPNIMARQLLSRAHANGIQKEQYEYAANLLELAKESFEVGPEQLRELNFWHGFAIYNRAIAIQAPTTLASARQSLPMFQSAKRLFEASRGYQQIQNLGQYLTNSDTYIEIQERVIQREGGG